MMSVEVTPVTETARLLEEVGRYFTVLAATTAEATWAAYAQTVVLQRPGTTTTEAQQWALTGLLQEA
jgi:hypothetical protein